MGCCRVQRESTITNSWHDAGEESDVPCSTTQKVSAAVGTIFTALTVAGAVWGGYNVYTSAFNYDTTLLGEGFIILGAAAASGITAAIAWSCYCNNPPDQQVSETSKLIV